MRRKSWWWAIAGLSVAVVAVLVVTALRLDFSGRTRENSVVWGANATLPTNFFPLISAGSSVATGQLEVQVLPGPFRLRPDLTVAYDADLLSTTGYNQIRSVKGKDGGRTVNVTFSPPYADWRSLFDQQLFPAHVMDRGSAAANCAMIRQGWPVAGGIPVSAGPWKIDKASVDVGQGTVVLTPDSAYWGRRPRLDRLTWQTFSSDASAVVGALASGEIDVADPEPQLDLIGQLRKLEPGVHTEVELPQLTDQIQLRLR